MTHWPLRDLILRTPCLELRPDDDEGLRELVDVAYAGVHPSEEMPFLVPWTESDPEFLGRGMLQSLLFAFDRLGARQARSGAFADNAASHRVSEKLGYVRDGTATRVRRGMAAVDQRLLVTPDAFVRPPWALRVEGVDGMLGLLGAG